jgi:tetratricopeptide (TPR) repeat protein
MADEAEALFYAAARHAGAGRHDQAASVYAQSFALNPSSWTCAENHGIALSDAGRAVEAIAAFERATVLVPARADSYSLLGRARFECGAVGGAAALVTALSLAPSSASLHYEVGRTDQLFGRGDAAAPFFASAQQLAHAEWTASMGCGRVDAWQSGHTRWERAGGAVESVHRLRAALVSSPGATPPVSRSAYGRVAPRPYSSAGWPRNARLRWPSLVFRDRGVVVAELSDVWISGNDGVVRSHPRLDLT